MRLITPLREVMMTMRLTKNLGRLKATLLFTVLLALAGVFWASGAWALEGRERARIEGLLAALSAQEDLAFVRNGQAYPAQKAASHLRAKLKRAGDKVATAEEFIEHLASGSSMSGRPYLVRYPDGREEPSRDYFFRLLSQQDAQP
jgi:hypothetical protein